MLRELLVWRGEGLSVHYAYSDPSGSPNWVLLNRSQFSAANAPSAKRRVKMWSRLHSPGPALRPRKTLPDRTPFVRVRNGTNTTIKTTI
ncbi:unnamed protein product, partial [Iphiclides podalirius]